MFKLYLKESLIYVIDHFEVESKRHFNSSLSFIVAASIGAVAIGFMHTLLSVFAFGYSAPFDLSVFCGDIMYGKHQGQFVGVANAIFILSLGLYGSFIISCINDSRLADKPKYTLKDIREFISTEEWETFLKLLLILLLIHFITFKGLQKLFHYNIKEAFYHNDNKEQIIAGLLYWIDSIVGLIKTYLSYILAILFVVSVYGHKINKQIIKEYKSSILVAIFLAFCINTLGTVLIGYINSYIIGLAEDIMPMSAFKLIPGVIKFCMYMVAGAYLNWGVSASLCMPIKIQAESEVNIDEVDEDNSQEAELPH